MDLEQLTKHQIILLTLLVSFVTSIATGIVTVSLMSQAPTSVTRTINQIVERTVQTVVPQTQGAAVVTTEKTVIVKDDDLTAQSIAAVQKSIVRITAKGGDELVARGVIVDAKGTTLTDSAALAASGAEAFEAILSDGTRVPVTVMSSATTTPIGFVNVTFGTSTAAAPATLADTSKLQLGQSVIRIGGTGADTVGEGVIASLAVGAGNSRMIEASVPSVTPGSVLITLFGQIIGIVTADSALVSNEFYTVATLPAAPPATKTSPKP
ncbi:MAG: trypsin-like peptidase domain-containing protein [Candidatus Adlerbacteria bacterium]